jgi:hypothetical protein
LEFCHRSVAVAEILRTAGIFETSNPFAVRMAWMFADPICDVIGGLLGAFMAVSNFRLQFRDEHAVLLNVSRGGHVWNVFDQKVSACFGSIVV